MSTRQSAAVSGPRGTLVEAGIRVLAGGGPQALQARRLAAEVGMSTMAVYTHFGGMEQLVGEIVREGFVRFGQRLEQAPRDGDPVADLLALGLAYRDWSLANPQLYRVMFGVTAPSGRRGKDPILASDTSALPEGQAAFAQLVTAMTRVIGAAGPRGEEPSTAAAKVWSAVHGYVLLEIAGYFADADAERVLLPLLEKLVT